MVATHPTAVQFRPQSLIHASEQTGAALRLICERLRVRFSPDVLRLYIDKGAMVPIALTID